MKIRTIEGVVTRKLRTIHDERGWLMEILRSDWDIFQKFGQVYVTTAYPNVAKAWHMHKKQTDHVVCIKGLIKLALYDGRDNSPTKGEINEFFMGERKPMLVKIPPGVWHGFKAIQEIAFVVNVPTELYNYEEPDEHRLPPDTDKIQYDWGLTPGLKHG